VTRVEWTYTVETSRLLRTLAFASFGAIGGLFVAFAALALFVLAGALLAGEFAVLALLLAFGLLGARRLATHAALSQVEGGYLSARDLAGPSVAWAVVFVAALALGAPPWTAFATVSVAILVFLPVAAALRSEGFVDTEDGRFEVNNRGASLAAVDRVNRHDFGPVTVLRVRYHDGAGGASDPRIVSVPRGDADRIRAALESSDADPPESDRNPTIARTLYAFAVGSFALAAAFAYFAANESGDAVGIGVYVALFAGLFGVLFAWLGYVEG